MRTNNRLISWLPDWISVLMILLIGALLWFLLSLIPYSVFKLLQMLITWTVGHTWRQAVCSITLMFIAFALYTFRERKRMGYAIFEIIVAFGGFWYALGNNTNLEASAAAIIASIYVFVRGADNYKLAIVEHHRREGLDVDHKPLPILPYFGSIKAKKDDH